MTTIAEDARPPPIPPPNVITNGDVLPDDLSATTTTTTSTTTAADVGSSKSSVVSSSSSPTSMTGLTPTPPHSPRMTSRPRVYVTRRIPQKGVDILLRHCDVKQWDAEQAVPHGELLHSVAGTMAILCMPCDVIDRQVLIAAGPELQVVATISPTTSHIDTDYCQTHGVKVITCPRQSAHNFAELTVALVLLTIKDSMTDDERLSILDGPVFHECSKQKSLEMAGCIHSSNWRPQLMRRQSEEQLAYQWSNGRPANTNCSAWKNIAQKTFGVYGMTKTGMGVAHVLETLGVGHILLSGPTVNDETENSATNAAINTDNSSVGVNNYHNSSSLEASSHTTVPLTRLLSEADIICVCGSDEEKTETVFGRESFKQMKTSAILIASQSEEQAIDYVALYEALRDGRIRAAGLNDCNQVPVPFKTPLLGLKNCIFLPQTQESVYDMRHKVSVLVAKNLIDALKPSP